MDLDSGTKIKLQLLYPDFSVRVIRVYADMWENHRIQMRMTEGIRTISRQKALYDQGRTQPGAIVTNAPPGFSLHHYGVACDSCQKGKDPWNVPWEDFGRYAQGHGLYAGYFWPGSKKDRPHIELSYGGMSVEQMANLYKNGGLRSVWSEFDRIRGVKAGSEWDGPGKPYRLTNVGEL